MEPPLCYLAPNRPEITTIGPLPPLDGGTANLADCSSRYDRAYKVRRRIWSNAINRRRSVLQGGVTLDTIYEQYGHSPVIPKLADEAALTGALVAAFETWMQPGSVAKLSVCEKDAETIMLLMMQEQQRQALAVAQSMGADVFSRPSPVAANAPPS